MIRIVIPVSAADVHLLDDFCSVLALSDLSGAVVDVMPSRSVADVVDDSLLAAIAESRWTVDDFPHGWPIACNLHFQACLDYLRLIDNQLPWIWHELDAVPVRRDWVAKIAEAYQSCQTPFMGLVQPSYLSQDGGESYVLAGRHVTGSCCVYPADFYSHQRTIYPATAPIPFDMAQATHMFAQGVMRSKLWQNNACSHLYRRVGGRIECDVQARAANYPVDFRRPISPGVAVVHGCKDNSLAKLVLQRGGNLIE